MLSNEDISLDLIMNKWHLNHFHVQISVSETTQNFRFKQINYYSFRFKISYLMVDGPCRLNGKQSDNEGTAFAPSI
jgi:hypothetical protein